MLIVYLFIQRNYSRIRLTPEYMRKGFEVLYEPYRKTHRFYLYFYVFFMVSYPE